MLKLLYLATIFSLGINVSAQVVQIPEQVEVSSDTLVLSDIAGIDAQSAELAQIPIGHAPYPGHYRWLKRVDLERYLRKWGVDLRLIQIEMKDPVLITRASQGVPRELIRRAVESFLKMERPDLEFLIEKINFPGQVILPEGDISIHVNLAGGLVHLDQISLKLDFFVEGERYKSQWTRVALRARVLAVVTSRDVPYGYRLQSPDLVLREKELHRLDEFLTQIDGAVGNVTKRRLQAGEIVRRQDLKRPILVKRGDDVTVVARGNSFIVSTLGRARDGGSMGDYIQIENLQSKQTLRGIIVGERKVQVRF